MVGFPIHIKDTGDVGNSLKMASPTWWLTSTLLQRELRSDAFKDHNHVCKNKQVRRRRQRRHFVFCFAIIFFCFLLQKQRPEIIVQVACPTPNGTAELEYLNMLPEEETETRKSTTRISKPEPETKYGESFFIMGIFWIVCFLILLTSFSLSTILPTRDEKKITRSSNKP